MGGDKLQLGLQAHLGLVDRNDHQNGDVVHLPTVPRVEGKMLLHFFRERPVSLRAETGRLRLADYGRRDHALERARQFVLLRPERAVDQFGQDRGGRVPLTLRPQPPAEQAHVLGHDRQDVLGVEVVPDAVGRQDEDVAVPQHVVRQVGLLGLVVQRHAAKDHGLGEDLGRRHAHLVRRVEGVRLRVGTVVHRPQPQLQETRVPQVCDPHAPVGLGDGHARRRPSRLDRRVVRDPFVPQPEQLFGTQPLFSSVPRQCRLDHVAAETVGKVGRVDAVLGPSSHPVRHGKGRHLGVSSSDAAHEIRVLPAVGTSRSLLLHRRPLLEAQSGIGAAVGDKVKRTQLGSKLAAFAAGRGGNVEGNVRDGRFSSSRGGS